MSEYKVTEQVLTIQTSLHQTNFLRDFKHSLNFWFSAQLSLPSEYAWTGRVGAVSGMLLMVAARYRDNHSYCMAPGTFPLASNYSLALKLANIDW